MATRKTQTTQRTTQSKEQFGPALGYKQINPLQDFLRIVQNIEGLSRAVTQLQASQESPQSLNPQQLIEVQKSLQSDGTNPLNLTNLPGQPANAVTSVNGFVGAVFVSGGTGIVITPSGGSISFALTNVGPGAGTYTVGAKLTGLGSDGTITIDAQGRVVAISQAT